MVCGLDYIFTIAGGARIVSTDPQGFSQPGFLGIAITPMRQDAFGMVRVHRYSALHSDGSLPVEGSNARSFDRNSKAVALSN